MNKCISILGSTGSIGVQAIDVVEHLGYKIDALTTNKNVRLLEEQARRLKPRMVAAVDEKAASELKTALRDTGIKVLSSEEGLMEAATGTSDIVLTSVVGMAGLLPTLAAIDAGKTIALANKETLVCAGKIVMERAKEKGVSILPVDSEHSALFQCINGEKRQYIKRMILTASGGPFFGKTAAELEKITPEDALRHPNWKMGAKITVDSATLMNKGLEFIEAMWLYDMEPSQISILVHRESIVHSLVEFADHSTIAQLSLPDMRLPIQYALSWPERTQAVIPELDLAKIGTLRFFEPDFGNFRCLTLAMDAAKRGGNACAVLNGANEAAVELFLSRRIGFNDIAKAVEGALSGVPYLSLPSLDDLLQSDRQARDIVSGFVP